MGSGVGERAEHVEELDDRSGPAVHHEQREGVRLGRTGVHEVDALTVDGGRELVEGVDPRLLGPPVEMVDPVRHQLPEVGQIGALIPVRPVDGVRVPGAAESVTQVVEGGLGHVDAERLEAGHAGERSDVWTFRPG